MATSMQTVVARNRETGFPVCRPGIAVRLRRLRVSPAALEGALFLLMTASLVVLAGSALGRFLISPSTPPARRVVVQEGDSLWRIAARHGDPDTYILRRVDAIVRRNNIRPGERLQPGDILYVPAPAGAPGKAAANRQDSR